MGRDATVPGWLFPTRSLSSWIERAGVVYRLSSSQLLGVAATLLGGRRLDDVLGQAVEVPPSGL